MPGQLSISGCSTEAYELPNLLARTVKEVLSVLLAGIVTCLFQRALQTLFGPWNCLTSRLAAGQVNDKVVLRRQPASAEMLHFCSCCAVQSRMSAPMMWMGDCTSQSGFHQSAVGHGATAVSRLNRFARSVQGNMSSTPIYSDLSLWNTLRTRRRRKPPMRGADAIANRYLARAKNAKMTVAALRREANAVVAMEREWAELGSRAFDERITDLRARFARRKYEKADVREGFAATRELAWRTMNMRPYPVQIMGAMGLFHKQIVEMRTGEGKTLTAAVAATMLGWLRRPVHVITVNDYLAERDADEFSPLYRKAGLTAGAVLSETEQQDRARIYRLPIVYTTQKELVADWLRDQLRLGRIENPLTTRWKMPTPGPGQPHPAESILVPGLFIAIVDELDAVLIDEAVTPLIIAQPRSEDAQADLYTRARDLGAELDKGKHYSVNLRERKVELTRRGREKLTSLLSDEEHGIWRASRRREELVTQALVAQHLYHQGQHYQIVEDKIVIVDEYTGRSMPDRQWQHGLHQAVEVTHDLEVTADRDTLASMSFQRFFMQYPHLCGMTGTAAEAKPELESTYGLPVRVIPTHKPVIRKQLKTLIYATQELKWAKIVDEIREMHNQGRPVLVGTRSIEASEYLSGLLNENNLPDHQILNAVHHEEEAQIVSKAGLKGAIMVATNMAGRGTDIKLTDETRDAGGLHVMLTELHTARRIDRQLFGRSGRQGDPGSAREILSLEDDLVLKFAGKSSAILRKKFSKRREPLPGWVRLTFELAQRRAQRQAFQGRAATLKREEDLDRALPA